MQAYISQAGSESLGESWMPSRRHLAPFPIWSDAPNLGRARDGALPLLFVLLLCDREPLLREWGDSACIDTQLVA